MFVTKGRIAFVVVVVVVVLLVYVCFR